MRYRNLKVFKEEVEKLTAITQKTVESIQLVIARQNSFIQSIDAMSSNMKELIQTTRSMDYKSLKLDDTIQEENDVIVKALESTTKACDDWFLLLISFHLVEVVVWMRRWKVFCFRPEDYKNSLSVDGIIW